MNKKKSKQTSKKPYLPPELQACRSLKEITLADTCNCLYWGSASSKGDCNFCCGGGTISCPSPPFCEGF